MRMEITHFHRLIHACLPLYSFPPQSPFSLMTWVPIGDTSESLRSIRESVPEKPTRSPTQPHKWRCGPVPSVSVTDERATRRRGEKRTTATAYDQRKIAKQPDSSNRMSPSFPQCDPQTERPRRWAALGSLSPQDKWRGERGMRRKSGQIARTWRSVVSIALLFRTFCLLL